MLLLTDHRIEVIACIVFKPTPSKSSISSGLAPTVWIFHHIIRSKAIWQCLTLGLFAAPHWVLELEVYTHASVFQWHCRKSFGQ